MEKKQNKEAVADLPQFQLFVFIVYFIVIKFSKKFVFR